MHQRGVSEHGGREANVAIWSAHRQTDKHAHTHMGSLAAPSNVGFVNLDGHKLMTLSTTGVVAIPHSIRRNTVLFFRCPVAVGGLLGNFRGVVGRLFACVAFVKVVVTVVEGDGMEVRNVVREMTIDGVLETKSIEGRHGKITVHIVVDAGHEDDCSNHIAQGCRNKIVGEKVPKGVGGGVHEPQHDVIHIGNTVLKANGSKGSDGPPHADDFALEGLGGDAQKHRKTHQPVGADATQQTLAPAQGHLGAHHPLKVGLIWIVVEHRGEESAKIRCNHTARKVANVHDKPVAEERKPGCFPRHDSHAQQHEIASKELPTRDDNEKESNGKDSATHEFGHGGTQQCSGWLQTPRHRDGEEPTKANKDARGNGHDECVVPCHLALGHTSFDQREEGVLGCFVRLHGSGCGRHPTLLRDGRRHSSGRGQLKGIADGFLHCGLGGERHGGR
eukprot:m.237823 g.237823  ORF g.237823 m.237823 type:complete len:446 (+) comp21421_c0_seq1:87-1424(+)